AVERRYVLAQALRALKVGGVLSIAAPKDRGGLRLARELADFGCEAHARALRHQRLCVCERPAALLGIEAAVAEGGPQVPPRLGLWSQPGLFSWDRLDAGSARLLPHLEGLAGEGADFGCGSGALALAVLKSPEVRRLALVDIDRRAVEAARRNIADPRAVFLQADLRGGGVERASLDFVAANPPFHALGDADVDLGRAFIAAAAAALKPDGLLRLVANRALPYEATIAQAFAKVRLLDEEGGYKIIEASAPRRPVGSRRR
ncbi:MAG: class I SAM-dependent methyltransferase, partial [Caulobacteraceae bacterium]